MTALSRRIRELDDALDSRVLTWFGIRAEDAESLMLLKQFSHSFGVTAPMRSTRLRSTTTLEDLTGSRDDLDTYDIDEDDRPEVMALRREIMRRLAGPSAVLTYRPSHFLSDILFASDRALGLGMFKERQLAYEHKPWVETELGRCGVRTVPWRYIAEEHRARLVDVLAEGPLVLRPSRSSGGVGMTLVRDAHELEEFWPGRSDHFVGVSPYFSSAIPLNIGACVFIDGSVSVHPGSLQLIGIDGCTDRKFGYCGNDFAAFSTLSGETHAEIDAVTRRVGGWLAKDGYRGAFGVDFLLVDGLLYFGEINARLQGSTALSCTLARRYGHSDIVLDHLAASLGLGPVEDLTVADWAREMPPTSQVVVHNTTGGRLRLQNSGSLLVPELADVDLQLLPRPETLMEPGAVLARLVSARSVTSTGLTVDSSTDAELRAVLAAFSQPCEPIGDERMVGDGA